MKNELLHEYDFLVVNIWDTVFVISKIDSITSSVKNSNYTKADCNCLLVAGKRMISNQITDLGYRTSRRKKT